MGEELQKGEITNHKHQITESRQLLVVLLFVVLIFDLWFWFLVFGFYYRHSRGSGNLWFV